MRRSSRPVARLGIEASPLPPMIAATFTRGALGAMSQAVSSTCTCAIIVGSLSAMRSGVSEARVTIAYV